MERNDFGQCLLWEDVVVFKTLILVIFNLEGCGGLERTTFGQFSVWEDVRFKGLPLDIFYFEKVC